MTITYGEFTSTAPRVTGARGKTKPAAVRLHLEADAVLSLKPARRGWRDRAGIRVECLGGRLWVTQQGDDADYLLEAGDTFHTSGPGRVVVQAMAAAALSVTDTPGTQ